MSHPKVISKAEYEVLAEFRYTLRQFMSFSENAKEKIELTPKQHQALMPIKGFPVCEQITIGDLFTHHQICDLASQLQIATISLCRQTSCSECNIN